MEIPNISVELISGFCDFVTKNKFAGTGRVLERLEHVCGHNYLYEQVCNVQVFIS